MPLKVAGLSTFILGGTNDGPLDYYYYYYCYYYAYYYPGVPASATGYYKPPTTLPTLPTLPIPLPILLLPIVLPTPKLAGTPLASLPAVPLLKLPKYSNNNA